MGNLKRAQQSFGEQFMRRKAADILPIHQHAARGGL